MQRRNFLSGVAGSVLVGAALDAGLINIDALPALSQGVPTRSPNAGKLNLLTSDNSDLAAKVYRAKPGRGSRALAGSELPYVYAFFDETAKKFVSPLDISPTLASGSYNLTSTLHAFNIKKANQAQFANLQNQVQLGFNATAPVTDSDNLTWVFLNAVDIFLAKPANVSQQLTNFTSGAQNGTPLQANPKVSVPKGIVNLQVTAFGQKKSGPWKTFFDVITKAVSSPIVSDVSKGFAIPGLATEALQFVDHIIDVYTQQEKLIPLWQTGSLEFAVTKDAHARFKMNPGLWVTIDSGYAQSSNFLDGHTVDFKFNSFRVLDKGGNPIDANYLVTDLKFDTA